MEEIQRKNIDEENEIESLLGDEQRVELIQILIYSASILKDENQKKEEIFKIIELAKKWNIDIKEQFGAKTEESLQKIDSRALLRNIKVKDVMFSLADIAASLGFFDNQEPLKEQLETYATMMKDSDKFSQEDISEMTFTNRDYEYQFLNENLTRTEYLANTLFMANKMAHLLVKSELKDGIESEKIDSKSYGLDLFTMFMRIKVHCMKLLINEKKKGENIRISNTKENFQSRLNNKTDYRDVINIEIPGYWQPFTIHENLDDFEDKDKKVIEDNCSFISQGFRYTFPLKISPRKHDLFSMLHEQNITKYNRNLDRIRWYLSASSRKDIVKKDIKRPKVGERRRYTGKELTKSKNNEQLSERGVKSKDTKLEGTNDRAEALRNEILTLLGVRKTKIDILKSLKEKVAEMEEELDSLESKIVKRQMNLSEEERDNQEK